MHALACLRTVDTLKGGHHPGCLGPTGTFAGETPAPLTRFAGETPSLRAHLNIPKIIVDTRLPFCCGSPDNRKATLRVPRTSVDFLQRLRSARGLRPCRRTATSGSLPLFECRSDSVRFERGQGVRDAVTSTANSNMSRKNTEKDIRQKIGGRKMGKEITGPIFLPSHFVPSMRSLRLNPFSDRTEANKGNEEGFGQRNGGKGMGKIGPIFLPADVSATSYPPSAFSAFSAVKSIIPHPSSTIHAPPS